jgi:hypothetical protein
MGKGARITFMAILIRSLFLFNCMVLLIHCGEKQNEAQETHFTKTDSLTESYLAYQDHMLESWNVMINDDNQKIEAMHHLIHELMVSHPEQRDQLTSFEERLDQLTRTRYTPKSMVNMDVIEEYDFATTSLVSELLAMAESTREFGYNTTLQKLADEIRAADLRVENYRLEYDSIVMQYNHFVETNQESLKEIELSAPPEKKPLFQIAEEE